MGRTGRLRYLHLRRTIIAVLATVAAFLLLGLIARMLLSSGPVRRLARGWIVSIADQSGFDLEIDDLSWGMIPPTLRLNGVRIEGPGIRAEIDSAQVDLARVWFTRQTIELGTVAADGVRLALEGTPQRRSTGESKLEVRVRHLQLTRLEFVGTDLPGKIDLALTGMEAGWSSDDGAPTGFMRVDRADLQLPGMNSVRLAVAARLRLEDGLQLPSWTADGDGISLRGSGRVGGEIGTKLVATGTIDLETLDRIIKSGGLLSGAIDIDASLQPSGDELLSVQIRSQHLDVARFPLDDVAGRLVLADGGLRGELDRARFHGGQLNGTYSLGQLGGDFPHRVRVSGRGLQVAGILGSLGIAPAGIAGRLDTAVELDWNGHAFPLGLGRADIVFSPTDGAIPVSGPLAIELKGDRALTFTAENLELGQSILSWQGPLAIGSWQPSWSITANPAVLEEIIPMVNAWIGSEALPDRKSVV